METLDSLFASEYVSQPASTDKTSAVDQADEIRQQLEETAQTEYGTGKPKRIITRARIVE
jgi:hypothetical protein